MSEMIYLDNNATTRVDPGVLEVMLPYLSEQYGNPSSVYRFGSRVRRAVDAARGHVADLLGCDAGEIIFTSCGTESNNAALDSALRRNPDHRHVVTTTVEHSAILKPLEARERRGLRVTRVGVDGHGRPALDAFREAMDDETALATAMMANNETGVLLPARELGAIAHDAGVPFHTDAVQAVGKVPIRLRDEPIDFLSLSGHKLHAPKGVGVLFVNRYSRFQSFLTGGGQENGRRGGTENVASIIGLGEAARLARENLEENVRIMTALRDAFERSVLASVPGSRVHGAESERLPNTTNILFPGIEAEGMLVLLDQHGVCASSGSACTTGSLGPSHVLTAMGVGDEDARSSLRFSFSRFNTPDEAARAADIVARCADKLRSIRQPASSPVVVG